MKNEQTINDCWNKIGVWRQDADICPLLQKFVHCRNCDTFIEAGLSLLDRCIPENYIQENTITYSNSNQINNTQNLSCLIFRLGDEWHAIQTEILSKIHEITEIHSIPHNKQAALEGLACINGEMQICISLNQIITGKISTDSSRKIKSRMVLIKLDSGMYAFKACEVLGIYPVDINTFEEPPASVAHAKNKVTESVFAFENKSVGLINKSNLEVMLITASS